MTKPPPILIIDTNTAAAASQCAGVAGMRPPPIVTSPPTAVRPLMALVTDMRGEWSAGVTAATRGLPARQASARTVMGTVRESPAAIPMRASAPTITDAEMTWAAFRVLSRESGTPTRTGAHTAAGGHRHGSDDAHVPVGVWRRRQRRQSPRASGALSWRAPLGLPMPAREVERGRAMRVRPDEGPGRHALRSPRRR